ncbi:hypothetical protein KSP39_PZI004399 [Platanthera zijinensis]|uniref:Uncharacterized protein n=1 Tax=Platanthera zijinensis TaxID=2320716 RepID=A0AAP0BZ89_9ASPA
MFRPAKRARRRCLSSAPGVGGEEFVSLPGMRWDLHAEALGMTKNPKFLEEVSKTFGKDDEILIVSLGAINSLLPHAPIFDAGLPEREAVAHGCVRAFICGNSKLLRVNLGR